MTTNVCYTYYQWDGMKDHIDQHNPIPIAELQYQCGVSVNMQYGPDGSGAYSNMVPNSLNAYFGLIKTLIGYLIKNSLNPNSFG